MWNAEEKSPLWEGPTTSAIQTELHCAAALSLRPPCGRGFFFFFLVRSLWCLGRAFPWPVFETEASNQATQCKSKAWRRGVGGGACALLTALSGSRDNKSIDCPSPVGAKCKQIEKDGEQSRLVTETDILNRGAATNEMSLWLFPSSPRYDGCHSCTHCIW